MSESHDFKIFEHHHLDPFYSAHAQPQGEQTSSGGGWVSLIYFRGKRPTVCFANISILSAVCRVCGGVHVLVTIFPPRWPTGRGRLTSRSFDWHARYSIKKSRTYIQKKEFPFIAKSKGEIKLFFFPG